MTSGLIEFGFYPEPLDLDAGPVRIRSLANLSETVAAILASHQVDENWIYPGPQQVHGFGGHTYERPYPSRIFGMPKTHTVEHLTSAEPENLNFHLWSLSFFLGIRLTSIPAGFLDCTPVKPEKLNDFLLLGNGEVRAVELAEAFWQRTASMPAQRDLLVSAVHALFLGYNPRLLEFERFIYNYTAIDACFALARLVCNHRQTIGHADRIFWMCNKFQIPVPDWADTTAVDKSKLLAPMRNATLHEALFMGAPLGFASHVQGANPNINLQMQALVCRLLVALVGGAASDYVRTPVNSRQRYPLHL